MQCLKTGSSFSFSLSIRNGINFQFSNPHPKDQVSRNINRTNTVPNHWKKTPSQRRRDQRRWEDFRANKGLVPNYPPPVTGLQLPVAGQQPPAAGQQPQVAGKQPPVAGQQPPVAGKQPPVADQQTPVADKESPLVKEATEAMEIVEEIVPEVKSETIPVITFARNTSFTKDDSTSNSVISSGMSKSTESTQPLDIPLPISPINSPPKNETTEVRLLFCAPNQSAALKMSKNYNAAKFLGPHSSNKRHHFYFSTKCPSANLPGLKEAANSLSDIILFHVVPEKKNYTPEEPLHCQACQRHLKN